MNSPEHNLNSYVSKKENPQVENLFQALNISEADKKEIQSEFYRIANMIYGCPQRFSSDTISKIRLGETNRDSFIIMDYYESTMISEYFDFIHSHIQGEKIWRVLSAYYNPRQE